MSKIPNAYISHSLKNRVRLRVPEKRKSDEYFKQAHKELSKCEGILGIETNPETGSILIRHEGDFQKIKRHSHDKGVFIVAEGEIETNFDVAAGAALVLTALAAYQAAKGFVLPPAWTLVRDALDFYFKEKEFSYFKQRDLEQHHKTEPAA